ncbi:hypothetical protein EPA93_08915 [Ktedonosporobacter rubrisoli]|uniref:Uncharacterized protein n=1 Tax=Ktedonosporobacter rubrisoli TaxID=2509675 RepID=A0A4P6JM86_KTERU|nr:hypothetical protein [Ktedonosporobacter rubrisoli]QBD76122.1 hypothetical protein EPA93_08915 [Ktedonosporobacter rubrisoli]
MKEEQPDEVYLSTCTQIEHWPLELAEKLLDDPLPWGPPAYAFGHYVADQQGPEQCSDFLELVSYVDGAYERHGDDSPEAWKWADIICRDLEKNGTLAQYTTQDLLDILFLHTRYERYCDGHIRSVETLLRKILQAVVQRVHSLHPPVFKMPEERKPRS